MSKRKPNLSDLWIRYINQKPAPPSKETMEYVAALKARVDVLELDNALLQRDLKLLAIHSINDPSEST